MMALVSGKLPGRGHRHRHNNHHNAASDITIKPNLLFLILTSLILLPFAICPPPPPPETNDNVVLIKTFPTYTEWADSNAKILNSIRAHLATITQSRHVCPIGSIPSLPPGTQPAPSTGFTVHTGYAKHKQTLSFLLEGLEHLLQEFCASAVPFIQAIKSKGFENKPTSNTLISNFRQKWGLPLPPQTNANLQNSPSVSDNIDENDPEYDDRLVATVEQVKYILTFLQYAFDYTTASRIAFNSIENFLAEDAPIIWEKDNTRFHRTAFWVDDAMWADDRWPYSENVAFAHSGLGRRRLVQHLERFLRVANGAVNFAAVATVRAEELGLMGEGFTDLLIPHKFDPDFGVEWERTGFNAVELFERLWGWYGCWAGPMEAILEEIRQLSPVPGLENVQDLGSRTWTPLTVMDWVTEAEVEMEMMRGENKEILRLGGMDPDAAIEIEDNIAEENRIEEDWIREETIKQEPQ
ncbi:hypothetical protein TWF694_010222 [Orbilia ellipsospora]|uniref:Uncharacterized protein n=1 Tax=Orbilia ellipsospora TaxID=2528407 RepID=A0AAV9X982_9PEZI